METSLQYHIVSVATFFCQFVTLVSLKVPSGFLPCSCQIPLWAVLVVLYYSARRRPTQAVKPTPQWGPGDRAVRRAIMNEQAGIVGGRSAGAAGKYAYDNDAMNYNYHM